MKKIFNFRPVVYVLLSILLGTFFVLSFFVPSVLIKIVLIVVAVMFLAFSFWHCKKYAKKFVFVLIVIGFALSCISSAVCCGNCTKSYSTSIQTITARVCKELGKDENYGNWGFVLENIVIVDSNEKVNGKAYFYSSADVCTNFAVGTEIVFSAKVSSYEIEDYFNSGLFRNGICCKFSSVSNIRISNSGKLKLDELFRQNVYFNFCEKLEQDDANLFYAMMFGDTTKLDNATYEAYQKTGISHLLAVSGLHMGFVVLVLNFLLCKLVKNKKISFFIIVPFMLFYAYLAGFSPSVLRAFLMTIILMLSQILGTCYDGVSSLGLTAILILLFKPLFIFDVGFLLSFSSVFGIVALSPILTNFFKKYLGNKLAETLSVTMSAQIGILPICVSSFGTISLLSIPSNLILVPVASVGFMILFVVGMLGVVVPPVSIFLCVPKIILDFVNIVSGAVARLELCISVNNVFGVLSVLYFVGMVLVCDLCFLKKKDKLLVGVVTFGLYFLTLLLFNL